jgi:hypothetical protein
MTPFGAIPLLHFDFYVATGRQREVHQGVDGFGRRLRDVDQAFVNAHFELLAALFVHVRAFDNRERAAVGRQWNRAGNGRASTQGSINDLLCCLVNYFVVVGL